MKASQTIFTILLFVVTLTSVQAQKKWISGMYLNNNIKYYENGKMINLPTVWSVSINGNVPNNKNIVVYGEFKEYQGSWYFDIEKLAMKVELYNGTFSKRSWNCPIAGTTEGIITLANGKTIEIASFEPLQDGQPISVTEASWGTKECKEKTHAVYYVKSIQLTSHYMEQTWDDSK